MASRWLKGLTVAATPDELPILARTRRDLVGLLADRRAPLRQFAMALMGDPAMALRVLQRANAAPRRDFSAEVVTLEDAAHRLGTQTLLRLESEAGVDDAVLSAARLASYRRGAGRAVLAALLAQDWAEVDRDRFPSEVALAALLNNLGELYLLAHGDARINRYLQLVDSRHVLPHEAEYVSLCESLEELGRALAVRWGLPEMVREAMRARNARHPRTLCVMLASQAARYAFTDWRHPMRHGDLRMVADLLELDMVSLTRRINTVLEAFNETAGDYGLTPLTCLPLERKDRRGEAMDPPYRALFCLAPRADEFRSSMVALDEGRLADRDAVFATLLRGLHRGLGLNRVVFAAYCARRRSLAGEFLVGTDFELAFNRFRLPLDTAGLFGRLLAAPAAVWVNDRNRSDARSRIPAEVSELIGVTRFFVMSVWVEGRPVGLVYADRRSDDCRLDLRSYEAFQRLVGLAGANLARLEGAKRPMA